MRTFVTPVANFIQQYYPNDFDSSVDFRMDVMASFRNFLNKMPVNLPMIATSQKDVESLAKLMKMLK